jgi:hypothetical protein
MKHSPQPMPTLNTLEAEVVAYLDKADFDPTLTNVDVARHVIAMACEACVIQKMNLHLFE